MAETIATGDADQDRLPWLESADPEPEASAPVWRTVLMVLVGLLTVAAIAFALLRHQGAPTASGTGDLINAQDGPYKTKAEGADGMQVAGRGDTAIATSEGKTGSGSVNLNAVPEAPVDGRAAAVPKTPATTGTGRVEATVPTATARLEAKAPATAAQVATAASGGGSVVQLASFPTEAQANAAWNQLSRRFAYLAPLGKAVQPAEVKGRTVYRLRVNTGSASQASDLCGKLKLAGENCFIAR